MKQIWVDIPFRMEVLLPRHRTPKKLWLRTSAPIHLADPERFDNPEALVTEHERKFGGYGWRRGARPAPQTVRKTEAGYEGALWRQVWRRDEDKWVAVTPEMLERRAANPWDWANPFVHRAVHGKMHELQTRDELMERNPKEILQDGEEMALAIASRTATRFLVHDGKLFRRAADPVWLVRFDGRNVHLEFDRVVAVPAEASPPAFGIAFRADRSEQAAAFARFLSDRTGKPVKSGYLRLVSVDPSFLSGDAAVLTARLGAVATARLCSGQNGEIGPRLLQALGPESAFFVRGWGYKTLPSPAELAARITDELAAAPASRWDEPLREALANMVTTIGAASDYGLVATNSADSAGVFDADADSDEDIDALAATF